MECYVIHVTKKCNCNCAYCYEDDKTSVYTWPEVKSIIDDLIAFNKEREFNIEFLGGEPMLAWDLIKQSYEYIEADKSVYVCHYTITTNGTILEEEQLDYLSKNPRMSWVPSLDGHAYANMLRVLHNGKNTFDIVIENIKKYQAFKTPSIHMVIHPYNVALLYDSIKLLYDRYKIKHFDIGTIEKVITIDEHYCKVFLAELDKLSNLILTDENYKDLHIAQFHSVKPYEDVRTYIRDSSGKIIAESYGRSKDDLTQNENQYNITKCEDKNLVSEMIYNIRKGAFDNHQKNIAKKG